MAIRRLADEEFHFHLTLVGTHFGCNFPGETACTWKVRASLGERPKRLPVRIICRRSLDGFSGSCWVFALAAKRMLYFASDFSLNHSLYDHQ